jgi:hypothetical protein
MIKLKTEPKSLILSPESRLDTTGSIRRFLVLVPPVDADLAPLGRRVWELANAAGADVKFFGLCDHADEEPAAAQAGRPVRDGEHGRVSTEAEVVIGELGRGLKWRWQAGDTVVCWMDPRAGLLRRPLSEILRAELDLPLYILSGLDPQDEPRPNRLLQAAAWIGSIAIIAGFFVLQAQFGQLEKGWTITLQLLSLPVEAWLIWAWNGLLG